MGIGVEAGAPDARVADGSSGHGDGGGDGSSASYTIGGTVTGLAGTGLTLVNGSETIPVSASGAFTFKTPVADGAMYAVTIGQQPSSPTQVCTVTSGSGQAAANVTNVAVQCVTSTFKVSGTLTGVAGTGLVLENDNTDDLALSADGTFTFATPVASGNAFSVTVKTQPSSPSQTCTVTGGTGTIGSSDVTTVVVNCSTDKLAVGGQVSGLAGNGVVLENNAGDDVTVSANGSFAFPTLIASGGTYAVTVKTQPSSPTEVCTVTSGAGSVSNAAVTSVRVVCSTTSFNVGGAVTGLTGTGHVLQDNAGDNLSVAADGTFQYATKVASGATYTVTALTQPSSPSQTCTVASGTGTVGGADITSVAVTCTTNGYTVGGTVAGLVGTGLVLQDNGGDNFSVDQNGAFTFATSVLSGGAYAVTVLTQPSSPTQTCTLSGDTGTVGSGNVTTVTINCTTNSYTVGGTVTGLAGTLVLDNNGEDATINQNGAFAFATPVASGVTYAVTVKTPPGQPSQTCVVTSGSGTVTSGNITGVAVACTTNAFTIGGTVTGLSGTGLVLQDNAGDNFAVTQNGAFAFATSVLSGATYNVTVLNNPTALSQTCTVASATGTVGGANVADVTITCTTNTYNVGGTVTGLVGTGLVLQDNGGDNFSVTQNGTFKFPTQVLSGGTYNATVLNSPTAPWQTCMVTSGSGSGTVTSSDVTTVAIVCTTNSYTVGGTVTGLSGSGLVLQDNVGDNLAVTKNGGFTFATSVASGGTYAVTVLTNPSTPWQTCTVSGGTGMVGGGPITSVAINCATNSYTVGGTISGLSGTAVLQNNAGNNLTLNANGNFAFGTPVPSDGAYLVTVLTNPSSPIAQTCAVTAGGGTVTSANVTSVTVTCTTNKYTIGGAVSGLVAGESVVLQDNGADNKTVTVSGNITFATSIPSGSTYSVKVLTSPSAPIAQTCVVTNGGGTVASANVTNVTVTCAATKYTIGGTVSGLTGTNLVLQDNSGDNLTVNANGAFTFVTSVASGSAYSATILTQPSGFNPCVVVNGAGTVTNANVTSITVSCRAVVGQYTVNSGPVWTSNPPTYTCQAACALLFGGVATSYSCSTTNTSIDHMASVDGWGDSSHCGGNYVSESYDLNTNYNCGSVSCSFSAYVSDHGCGAINYCWR